MRASALPDVYFSNINKHKSSIIHFFQMSEIFSIYFPVLRRYFVIGFDGCDLFRHFVEFFELKTGVSIINRRNIPSYRWNITPDVAYIGSKVSRPEMIDVT